jgi:hypothetical protein
MPTIPPAPIIEQVAFGKLVVAGYPPFKDAKLFPGGARDWDWRETGTDHTGGIRPGDV